MSKSIKNKNMPSFPLNFTANTTVSLNGFTALFQGSNNYDWLEIGDNYQESGYDNMTSRGTYFYKDANGVDFESYNYSGQLSKLRVTEMDISLLAFDLNESANPIARVAALANGDIMLESKRITINGELGLTGEYQVGDKTFTLINGIVTKIE